MTDPVSAPRVPDEPVLPSGLLVDAVTDNRNVVVDVRRVCRVVEHAAGVVLVEVATLKSGPKSHLVIPMLNYMNESFCQGSVTN